MSIVRYALVNKEGKIIEIKNEFDDLNISNGILSVDSDGVNLTRPRMNYDNCCCQYTVSFNNVQQVEQTPATLNIIQQGDGVYSCFVNNANGEVTFPEFGLYAITFRVELLTTTSGVDSFRFSLRENITGNTMHVSDSVAVSLTGPIDYHNSNSTHLVAPINPCQMYCVALQGGSGQDFVVGVTITRLG